MSSTQISFWLLFIIVTQSLGEDMRSVRMSLMKGCKFQCINTTCLPFININSSTIIKCQMACLGQIYCRAASFYESTANCQLFADISNEIVNMLTDTGVVTAIVITGTRSPPG
ncbi:hypothetical protein I4U23_016569 [Adineta vaga]|nr:hypothetical protein I4U23_016569 [Adineta vaga]